MNFVAFFLLFLTREFAFSDHCRRMMQRRPSDDVYVPFRLLGNAPTQDPVVAAVVARARALPFQRCCCVVARIHLHET